jgi:lysine/ornithine N-monooxygenase
MQNKIKMCIIGAGPSGLCTAKEIQENNPNIDIKIFEKSSDIGGVFANCYQDLTLVNNPFLVSFSDFPPEINCNNLKMWRATEYVNYLNNYAKKNNILKLIHFNNTVKKISNINGQWNIDFEHNGKVKTNTFDYLTICTGTNQKSKEIPLKNKQNFSGEIIRSSDLKDVSSLKDKAVVFIGLGETASDLIYLSRNVVKSSYVSIRRWPGYFIPRYHDNKPTDLDTSNIYHAISRNIDDSKLSFLTKLKREMEYRNIISTNDKKIQSAIKDFNSSNQSIKYLGPFRRVTVKSCGFIKAYLEGKINLKPKISDLKGKTVMFEDGSSVEADAIVLCAGHTFNLSFFSKEMRDSISSPNKLYKYMFIPKINNCCFIGFVRPNLGSLPSVSELQARYLSAYLSKKISLPNQETMQKCILNQQEASKWQFPVDFDRVSHIVDYRNYTRSLAKDLKVLPKQWRLFFSDIHLWYKINFSFLYPGIYRIHQKGPQSKKATSIIKQLPDRISLVYF